MAMRASGDSSASLASAPPARSANGAPWRMPASMRARACNEAKRCSSCAAISLKAAASRPSSSVRWTSTRVGAMPAARRRDPSASASSGSKVRRIVRRATRPISNSVAAATQRSHAPTGMPYQETTGGAALCCSVQLPAPNSAMRNRCALKSDVVPVRSAIRASASAPRQDTTGVPSSIRTLQVLLSDWSRTGSQR